MRVRVVLASRRFARRKTAHVIGHGGAGLHYIHDAVALRVRPAPQGFGRGHIRVILVNADGVASTARLRGISGAVEVTRGVTEPSGIVSVHATVALFTSNENRWLVDTMVFRRKVSKR